MIPYDGIVRQLTVATAAVKSLPRRDMGPPRHSPGGPPAGSAGPSYKEGGLAACGAATTIFGSHEATSLGAVLLDSRTLVLPLAALLAAVAPAASQHTSGIAGQLVDRATGAPVSGALVTVLGRSGTRPDSNGRFAAPGLPAGTYVVQVRALGYVAATWLVEVNTGHTTAVVLELEPAPLSISGVVIEGQAWEQRGMADFTRRREGGRGVFLTEDDIKEAQAVRLGDLLRNVPGVRQICRGNVCRVYMSRSRQCTPNFWVDGFAANNSTSLEMPVMGVIGIEVYRSASETPVEFLRGDNICGSIVIWTRSGL